MTDDLAALEDRLQRLEDLEAIRALFEEYIYHLDRGQYAEYAALYAKDGKMRLGPARADGPEEIERVARETFRADAGAGAGEIREGGLAGFHIISGPRIDLAGDRATAEVMWTVIARNADDKPVVTLVGHHSDELVREEGHWRLAKRTGFMDIP